LSNFQTRSIIDIEEIRQHIKNQEYLKLQSTSLKDKPYFETRVTKVTMAMFYTLIGVLRNKEKLSEPFAKTEIRYAIRHPLSLRDILCFSQYKSINLMIWVLGILPPFMSVPMITLIGKAKKLI